MKKLLLIILFTVTTAFVYADTTKTDSTKKAMQQHVTAVQKNQNSTDSTKKTSNHPTWNGEEVKGADWILVWAPIVFFIIGVIFINYRTKGFKLQNALTENQYSTVTVINPLYVAPAAALPPSITPTITVSDTANGLPKSSTRYLALLTTTLTLIIAACLSSTYIYIYLSSGVQPEFDKLGDVLLALGIGVTPYAFNKVSTAVSGKNP